MFTSLKEYVTSFGHWGWFILVDVILTGVGAYLDISNAAQFPTWIWITLAIMAVIIAPFLAFHKLRVERDSLKLLKAKLELSDPILASNQSSEAWISSLDTPAPPKYDHVDLWRLRLTNIQPNSQAQNVRVQITDTKPYDIGELPLFLHRKNDNTPPYEKTRNISYGEIIEFDVIGIDQDRVIWFLYRSDLADELYAWHIPFDKIPDTNEMILAIGVYADPPTEGINRKYRAFLDSQRKFILEPYEDTKP